MSRKSDVIIIGGGQAGLATSWHLSRRNIDHVILERGDVGQRWRAERWNSLRLLTPNWMTRLPGRSYSGNDPHGFMHKHAVVHLLSDYSVANAAPVKTQTVVLSVQRRDTAFHIETTRGTWQARAVIVATGACDTPRVPDVAKALSPAIRQVTLDRYTSPAQIDRGGVLVVGASASGTQIASELQSAGRQVTLAAGAHTRIPRTYRGHDIMVWLNQIGTLNAERDPGADVDGLAQSHSFQLVGSRIGRSLSLATFQAQGGRVAGRMTGADGKLVFFGDTLGGDIARAEARQEKILRRIDDHINQHQLNVPAPDRIDPVTCPVAPTAINLGREGIKTIIWATGYRRDYSWLDIPVLSTGGEIIQHGGITPVRGLYTMGLPYMRRCNSTFIDGVGQDADDITREVAGHLGCIIAQAA